MKEDFLDRVRIASPCNMSWESMSGSDRARFCNQCELHVYDISQLSRKEAVTLIASTQGGICARIYRRSDGTVLTRDCPVGLRALRRRVSRIAGAALAALISLFSVATAQKRTPDQARETIGLHQIQRKKTPAALGSLNGVILDSSRRSVARAKVRLRNSATHAKLETVSNASGGFAFPSLKEGVYKLEVITVDFRPVVIEKLEVGREAIDIQITFELIGNLTGRLMLPVIPRQHP